MTRIIAVTQRVDIIDAYGERRDGLDQRWTDMLAACGLVALPMPNQPTMALALVEAVRPAGVLLTGGNDLAAYGGNALERDHTETALVAWARRLGLPVLGVCRGMQLLLWQAGATLDEVTGHVACRHGVSLTDGSRRTVNSFHRWAVRRLPEDWTAEAIGDDGVIESARHRSESLLGLMWHPERDDPFVSNDLNLIRHHFEGLP